MSIVPLTIVTTIISFLFFVGTLYYRKKNKYWKNKYNEIINPLIKPKPLSEHERWLQVRSQILLRDHFMCQECGYYKHLEVHHIVPRRAGGSDDPSNLVTLCKRCHDKKHPENRHKRVKRRKNRRRKRKNRHNFSLNNCPKKRLKMVDESDFLESIGKMASPERRQALYNKWSHDKLNQKS